MTIKLTPQELIGWLLWLLDTIVAVALAIVFTGIVLRYWGVTNIPGLPTSSPQDMAYLCGAWWLYRKARQ